MKMRVFVEEDGVAAATTLKIDGGFSTRLVASPSRSLA